MAKRFHDGFYAGQDERRRQEREDFEIMGAGRGHSNMPEEVILRDYPKADDYAPENLDDTIRGVDKQRKDDSKHKKPAGSSMY
jgi:hypothetical protein